MDARCVTAVAPIGSIRWVYKLPGDYYSYGQHFNVATPAAES